MGGTLGDHIARPNCVKRLVRHFLGDSRYLCVHLKFGLEVNKYVLAFLYLLFFRFLCCQGSFGTGDMEFATANIHIIRMGEHHPPRLQGSVRERCNAVLILRPQLQDAWYKNPKNTASRTGLALAVVFRPGATLVFMYIVADIQ